MIYTYEKFNLKFNNPFKKKRPDISIPRPDIDPYGEDDWEVLPPVLEIAKRPGKPYDQIFSLYCFRSELTSLEGIEKLVNLKWLFCYYNQLTSLEGIEKLVNLKALYCYGNRLTSIEGLENLVNLKRMDCSDNQLTNLKGLENLVNINWINCSYNQLTSLEGIENLAKLEVLYCHNNLFSNDYKKYLRIYCEKKRITTNM